MCLCEEINNQTNNHVIYIYVRSIYLYTFSFVELSLGPISPTHKRRGLVGCVAAPRQFNQSVHRRRTTPNPKLKFNS